MPLARHARFHALLLAAIAGIALALVAACGARDARGAAGAAAAPPTPDGVRALLQQRQLDAAEVAAQQLLADAQAQSGEQSLDVAEALGLLVEVRVRRGEASQPATRELAQRALAITEQAVGPDDPRTATRLTHLGHVARLSGDLAAARPLYERALAIREQAPGSAPAEVAVSLGDLASVLEDAGDFDGALPLYERALAVAEQALGPHHPDVATAMGDLANLLSRKGEYARAKPMLERALEIREQVLGPTHPDVAQNHTALAVLLRNLGDFAGAREHFERALRLKEQALGPSHPDLARQLNNLASLLAETGDFAGARPLFERALELRTRALGPEHRDVGISCNNLANVLLQTGDYAAARPLFEGALAIWEKTLGPDHPNVAVCLDNLGTLAANEGDLAGARRLHDRSLAIKEKALGPEHPSVAITVDDLASVAMAAGELAQAIPLYERALAIKEKALDAEHPEVARGLDNLGSALFAAGESTRALPLHQRALALRLQTFGPLHPDVALSHRNCAFSELAAGDTAQALASALAAEQVGRDHLRLTSRALVEREALRYASIRYGGLDLALALVAAGADSGRRDTAALVQVWDAGVRSRAVVLDEMGARHRAAAAAVAANDPAVDSLVTAVQTARERLAGLAVRGLGNADPHEYRQALEARTREKEAAERALAEHSARFQAELARARIGLDQVMESLPPKAALLAYCCYTPPALPGEAGQAAWIAGGGGGAVYLAFIGRRDEHGRQQLTAVPLGAASTIDSLAGRWRREAARYGGQDETGQLERTCRSAGEPLRRRVWDPVAPHLVDVDLVLVVPDGALHLVNLAALPIAANQYLVEERLLHVLSAERDVVRPVDAVDPPGHGLLAIGDPDYDRAPGRSNSRLPEMIAMLAPFRGARPGCAAFERLRFARLPQTRGEIEGVDRLWKRAHRRERVVALTGRQAGEARVKAELPGKRCVHLATHGFFLGDECPASPAGTLVRQAGTGAAELPLAAASLENPLLLSGLALAGGNRRQDAAPDGEDGVLTAEEVASLDLRGVEWAVLSACETATGDVRAGEGVFGLRRAFETAGAHALIMSLWSVEDEAGRAWMDALYRARLIDGLPTAAAVRQADLRVLQDRRRRQLTTHPSVWAGFIAAGDWR